jgi:hypothetical protein
MKSPTKYGAALLLIVILILLWIPRLAPRDPLVAWFMTMALLSAFVVISGLAVTGRWMGALIDERNVMSLSRFQMILWTILILSAFLTAALLNLNFNQATALDIALAPELWALMGISTTSLVGSPLILSTKETKRPDQAELRRTFTLLQKQGDSDATLRANGQIVANTDNSKARWSDMLTGEETGNAAHLDLTRIQMLFFTLVTALAYGSVLAHAFWEYGNSGIHELPKLSEGMIALIAISHTGYLVSKAVPHSQEGPSGPGAQIAPGTAGDHPPMG